jgi:hypothetical protein
LGRLKARLGLARLAASARPAAQQAGSGSGLARLVVWLGSGPPRVGFFLGRDDPWAAVGWLDASSSPPRGSGCLLFFSSLTGWAQLSASAGSDVASPDAARQMRVCVRVSAEARVRVWTPEGRSGKCLNGMAATRTRRRGRIAGVDMHGEVVVQARLRQGWVRCTHARESWFPRAAAWPCRARGTGIPGPRHNAAAVRRRR